MYNELINTDLEENFKTVYIRTLRGNLNKLKYLISEEILNQLKKI